MARPTDRDEAKTAVLNIRVTPTLKAKLETRAKMAGKKLSTECEARLQASMEETEAPKSSPETRQLLSEIEALIEAIEIGTGTAWHQGVGTWAAVADMLANGPIMARTPSHLGENDARLRELFDVLTANIDKREQIEAGLAILELPAPRASSIFWPSSDAQRAELREAIDAMNLPNGISQRALERVDELEAVDESDRQTRAKIDDIIEPYRQAIEDGRQRYVRPRKGAVLASTLSRLDQKPNALLTAAINADVMMDVLASRPKWPKTVGGLLTGAGTLDPQSQQPNLAGSLARLFNPPTKRDDDSPSTPNNAL